MNNERPLGFAGDDRANVLNVTSGGEGMTMVVRATGGVSARVELPFMIFKNANRNYPIQNVPDNIPGVFYRTSPKAFMDQALFPVYFSEKRAHVNYSGSEGVWQIFVDNYSAHDETGDRLDSLDQISADINYLPANTTHLIQPADSYVIAMLKTRWRELWNRKKLEMIRQHQASQRLGRILNPGR